MRIDKYLWCVRYYKTRNISSKEVKKGRVKVNGQVVKPSREVYPRDVIDLRKEHIDWKIEVLDIPPSRIGAKLVDIYRKDLTPTAHREHLQLTRLAKDSYRKKGEGRPTKKDRRDMDDFLDETLMEGFGKANDNASTKGDE